METHYVAYGLRLVSSFALPGTPAQTSGDAGLSSLRLTLQQPSDLERVWAGRGALREWRGLLGDGRELVLERGAAGDALFTYGELARFRLHADGQQLDCVPSGPGLDWLRALIGKVIPAISVMRGYEALHASAVDSPAGVITIMGPSGSGKSTLATEFVRRGNPLFADDAVVLAGTGHDVHAHPGTPHMNLAQRLPDGINHDSLGTTLGVLAGERWLAAHATSTRPRPIGLLCLLQREPNLPLKAHPMPANPLLLAPYMLGLSGDPERERRRFELYADLTASAALVRLTGDNRHSPGAMADELERTLEARPAILAGGAA